MPGTHYLSRPSLALMRALSSDESDFGGGSDLDGLKSRMGELYKEEELLELLGAHKQLTSEIASLEKVTNDNGNVNKAPPMSLHDLIMKTIEDSDDDQDSVPNFDENVLKEKAKHIRAIASDVDGTLLTSEQTIHPTTLAAVVRAIEESTSSSSSLNSNDELNHFFLATGKSKKGALDSLNEPIASLVKSRNVPGVYIQGLYCVDGNDDIIFERKLSIDAVQAAEQLAFDADVAIVAYDGDELYSTDVKRKEVIELSEIYGEPMSQHLPDGQSLASYKRGMHKILLMDDDVEKLNNLRPKFEELATAYNATVTQAINTMLEFLPGGCSKGRGVAALCESLGIDASKQLLALGDAENDIGMLEMAAVGVAVGNACELAKSSADFVMDKSNDEGGAGAAINRFIFDNSLRKLN